MHHDHAGATAAEDVVVRRGEEDPIDLAIAGPRAFASEQRGGARHRGIRAGISITKALQGLIRPHARHGDGHLIGAIQIRHVEDFHRHQLMVRGQSRLGSA
jgi:hypothetical protein